MKRVYEPKGTSISFYWNGKALEGIEGESLAAALMANGHRAVGRSFKYGRKRGLLAFGSEESNALVTLEPESNYQIPNMKASEVRLYNGLRAVSATTNPSFDFDWRALFKPLSRFMPVGFYYKTFKWPASFWLKYEKGLRQLAGFSKVDPSLVDPDKYVTQYGYCDIAVIGGGIAGMRAAVESAKGAKRVVLIEQTAYLGGESLAISNDPALSGELKALKNQIETAENIRLLTTTLAFSYLDQLLQAIETKQDHLSVVERSNEKARQVLHQIRPKKIILATGAHERPLLFENNDSPSIMLASAARRYLNQNGVLFATHPVIVTNNNSAYELAQDLLANSIRPTIVDFRSGNEISDAAKRIVSEAQLKHYCGYAPVQAKASGSGVGYGVSELAIAPVEWVAEGWILGKKRKKIRCNGVAMSGGYSPVIHLCVHDGSRATFCAETHSFMPPANLSLTHKFTCGSINGTAEWQDCLSDAQLAAQHALEALTQDEPVAYEQTTFAKLSVAPPFTPLELPYAFVDFQNDVKVSDIDLAIRENYQSIEHIKRYTATGFGTDQGKTSNINVIAIAASILKKPMNEVSTTTFRPPYNAITFGALSGGHQQNLFDAARYTTLHQAHEDLGAVWEQVGQWYRPRYYPIGSESMREAVDRECLAARQNVAMMDVSTLGKIDIKGKDARKFLSRIYTNAWGKLGINQARYGLMCDERGMIYDDGVSICLADDHFFMTTTSGGAARVYETLELWLQTEWTDLEVYVSSITDQWSAVAVVGPNARQLMASVPTDIDFDNDAFPFMHMREGKWNGLDVKVARISFSGEVSYEITIKSSDGAALWDKVSEAGKAFDITPYGTETMHVLRAEKGYIIVGQETDGSNTPDDVGMSWAIRPNPEMSFIGERSMKRSDILRESRKQLVGVINIDNTGFVLPEGTSLVREGKVAGHVTSSYYSAALGHSFGLAMLESGRASVGKTITASMVGNKQQTVKITEPFFYDLDGEKLRS